VRPSGIDFIELYVGNARQAAVFYQAALGFRLAGYRGPETGHRDHASYVLTQDRVRLVLTTALAPGGPVADHVRRHGDGVKDVAFCVPDARAAWADAVARGAASARAPEVLSDASGEVVMAAIQTYGDTIHSLVERRGYGGLFLPGFAPAQSRAEPPPAGLTHVDHLVGNVTRGTLRRWVRFYEEVLGFQVLVSFDDDAIATADSALRSSVVADRALRIKLPLNEAAPGRRRSQIDEFLAFYRGAGCQHIALATADIVATVRALRDRGLELLRAPAGYQDTMLERVGPIAEDVAALHELGILVDRDEEGYLLQIFTRPVQDRPTLFYEIIQRRGATSFGAGNFKALFAAVEREQSLRGNL
jgi:4-hydroxyphenylpyruvate dioxygenase